MMHRDDLTGRDLQENTSNISDLANRDGSSAEVDAILTKTDTVSDSLDLTEDEVDVDNILDAIKGDYDNAPNSDWHTAMNAALDRRVRETKAVKRHSGQRIVRMISTIAASVVVCVLVTSTAAYAFNWQAFFEFFAPISEIVSFFASKTEPDETSMPDSSIDAADGIVFGEDEAASTTAYTDYDEFVASNPEARNWLDALPEGYVFESGERSENGYLVFSFATFAGGQNAICIKRYNEHDEYVSAWLFEISSDKVEYVKVNGIDITFYRNKRTAETIGASWQEGKTIMNIWTRNTVPDDWIVQIVKKLTGGNGS